MPVLHLGTLAHTTHNPFVRERGLTIIEDGALLVGDDGRIVNCGSRKDLQPAHPDAEVRDHGSSWLIPGLIDGHIHFPQFYATASYGAHLLDWLTRFIFPLEARFKDEGYAKQVADAFVAHLLRHGTTTALVFGSQFVPATQALFDAAQDQGLRLITGLTLMDRGAPEVLLTTPNRAYEESAQLIAAAAKHPLLHYAITPRFALSCTPDMLAACGQLKSNHPEVFVQTHINENQLEIEKTREMFPKAEHYLDVYHQAGLLQPHTVLAHSIYTTQAELKMMKDTQTTVCHCPCSNLYLGSGLFPLQRHVDAGIEVMVGTDIGGGGNFSLLRELADVYKIGQMNHHSLDPARLLYLGTLGGAKGLGLGEETGNFETGKSADFLVIDTVTDTYLRNRLNHCESAEQQLFVLLQRADVTHIAETHVAGNKTG